MMYQSTDIADRIKCISHSDTSVNGMTGDKGVMVGAKICYSWKWYSSRNNQLHLLKPLMLIVVEIHAQAVNKMLLKTKSCKI